MCILSGSQGFSPVYEQAHKGLEFMDPDHYMIFLAACRLISFDAFASYIPNNIYLKLQIYLRGFCYSTKFQERTAWGMYLSFIDLKRGLFSVGKEAVPLSR